MVSSRILVRWTILLALYPLTWVLFGGWHQAGALACWGVAVVTGLCAWATSVGVRSPRSRQGALAAAIVATFTLAVFSLRWSLTAVREGALAHRADLAQLIEAHNAALPEGFPSRIEVPPPATGPGMLPMAIFGFVVTGLLWQAGLSWRQASDPTGPMAPVAPPDSPVGPSEP